VVVVERDLVVAVEEAVDATIIAARHASPVSLAGSEVLR
jgi:hypothetical protein